MRKTQPSTGLHLWYVASIPTISRTLGMNGARFSCLGVQSRGRQRICIFICSLLLLECQQEGLSY